MAQCGIVAPRAAADGFHACDGVAIERQSKNHLRPAFQRAPLEFCTNKNSRYERTPNQREGWCGILLQVSEPARVICSNDHLLVVDKPAGVSLATRRAEPGAAVLRLCAALPEHALRATGADPASLLLVHRLDVGTSGIVVLARDAQAHRELVTAFATRLVAKTYVAVVWGRPAAREGRWTWPLGPDRRDRRRMRVEPEGRPSATAYRVVGGPRFACLVVLRPETGRTHQLRVHLAHAGHPIVGDDLYGGPRDRGVRDGAVRRALQPPHTLLHAWRLELPAIGGAPPLALVAAPPQTFARALEALSIERLEDAADGVWPR
jgi:RluA family pseudouridine synthase